MVSFKKHTQLQNFRELFMSAVIAGTFLGCFNFWYGINYISEKKHHPHPVTTLQTTPSHLGTQCYRKIFRSNFEFLLRTLSQFNAIFQGTISLPQLVGGFDLRGNSPHHPKICRRDGNHPPQFFSRFGISTTTHRRLKLPIFLITFINIFKIFLISYGFIIERFFILLDRMHD